MANQLTDLEVASQLEHLWLKINQGIALADRVLEKAKLLDNAIIQKQEEAIAELESRYQEVLKIQSSLPDLHQEFLELGEIKRNVKSLLKDVTLGGDLSNLAGDIYLIKQESSATKSECDRLKEKLTALERLLVNTLESWERQPAIADKSFQEQSSLVDELKDFYNHAFSNLKRIENQTLETFNDLTVTSQSRSIQIDNLLTQLENTLQNQQNLKQELESKLELVLAAEKQLQGSIERVNSELAIQGMKQVEEIHKREELASEKLSAFADSLAEKLNSNLQKDSLQQEISAADRAISQIILQRQELQRELASSSTVIQRLNQIKIDSANSSNSSQNESDELLNKLKTIEQKYDRLRQSFWWLSLGIAAASGVAIAFGGFIFR